MKKILRNIWWELKDIFTSDEVKYGFLYFIGMVVGAVMVLGIVYLGKLLNGEL